MILRILKNDSGALRAVAEGRLLKASAAPEKEIEAADAPPGVG